jgi:hypothetical protein
LNRSLSGFDLRERPLNKTKDVLEKVLVHFRGEILRDHFLNLKVGLAGTGPLGQQSDEQLKGCVYQTRVSRTQEED